MEMQTFYIRSLAVQNIIMGVVAALLVGLLIRSVWRQKRQHAIATVIWGLIAFWFFNSPLWGFSAVTVSRQGLKLHYGLLSVFKNTSLPPDTPWKIRRYLGGIRKLKNLYFFELAGHQSLKVRGANKLDLLKGLGVAIDSMNERSMGRLEDRPVNE